MASPAAASVTVMDADITIAAPAAPGPTDGSIMLCVIRLLPSSPLPYSVLGRETLYEPGSADAFPAADPGLPWRPSEWWRGARRTGEGEVRELERRTFGRPGPAEMSEMWL